MGVVATDKRFEIEMGIDITEVMRTYIRNVASGNDAIYQAIRQALENVVDAGGTYLKILLDEKTKTITFIDNGCGMGKKERTGFHSLHKGSKDGINTIGRNNSGRVAFLALAESVTVVSRTMENGKLTLFEFPFSLDVFSKIFEAAALKKTIDIAPIKAHALEKHIEKTGTVIVLEGVNWDKVHGIQYLRRNLPNYFSRKYAKMILLNGSPLPEKQQVGEPLIYSVEHPILGTIDVDLFLVSEMDKSAERDHEVRLGANNPIFKTWQVFLQKYVTPEQIRFVPVKLLNEQLGGTILIKGLNKFREHSSHDLLDERFVGSKEQAALIDFLATDLGPKLDAAFQHLKEAERQEEDLAWKATITEALNPIFKYDPKKHNPPAGKGSQLGAKDLVEKKKPEPQGLQVNHREIELLPGENQIFEVTRKSGTSGKFVWDVTQAGGVFQPKPKTGASMVNYEAGSTPGHYSLGVADMSNPELCATISINIVEEKTVTISPKRVKIQQGKKQAFRLANSPTQDVQWSVEGPGKGFSIKPATGCAITVSIPKNAALAQYQLVARYGDKEVRETFIVEEPPKSGEYLLIEDTLYILEAPRGGEDLPYVAKVDPDAGLIRGTKTPVMLVNREHSIIKGCSNKYRLQLLIPGLVAAHATYALQRDIWKQPEMAPQRMETLRLKVTEELQKQ